ncbi:MAG TPA: hypothetical protein VJ385_21405 [Fibrobacteria bacterium]|nr:hypothetical protein [Fibrobacteria bacterium]
MNTRPNKEENEDKGRAEGVSLRKLERLMQGSLSKEEAASIRRAIHQSPDDQAYLERYSALRSGRSYEDYLARTRNKWKTVFSIDWAGLASGWRPRLAGWSLAAVMLFLGTWTWRAMESGRNHPGRESNWLSKGPDPVVIRASLRGLEFEPGDSISVRVGDTLQFAYRSSAPSWIQIWYQEDASLPLPAKGIGSMRPWMVSTSWSRAPYSMILEGAWKRQIVWMIWSISRPLQPGDVERILAGEAIAGARAIPFNLSRME